MLRPSNGRRRGGRTPLPVVPRWSPYSTVDDDPFGLAQFGAFPLEARNAPYVAKNIAASLVESDSDAWASVQRGRAALRCRGGNNSGRVGGSLKEWKPPCGTWLCEPCAIQKVIPHLFHAYNLMRDHSTIFVNVETTNELTRDTYRRAVGRGDDFDFPGYRPWAIRVERDGVACTYASGRPTGAAGKRGRWFDAIDAFEHLRTVALTLPGLRRVPSYIGTPGPPDPEQSGIVLHAADLNADELEAFHLRRDELANDWFGLPFADLLRKSPTDADAAARQAASDARGQS